MKDKIAAVKARISHLIDRAKRFLTRTTTPAASGDAKSMEGLQGIVPPPMEAEIDDAIDADNRVESAELNLFNPISKLRDGYEWAKGRITGGGNPSNNNNNNNEINDDRQASRRNGRLMVGEAEIDAAIDFDEAEANFNQNQVNGIKAQVKRAIQAVKKAIIAPAQPHEDSKTEAEFDEVNFDGQSIAEIDDAIDLDTAAAADNTATSKTSTDSTSSSVEASIKALKSRNAYLKQQEQQPPQPTPPAQPTAQQIALESAAAAESMNQILPPHIHVSVDIDVLPPKPKTKRNAAALRKIANLIKERQQ
jgi:hypothetical protein